MTSVAPPDIAAERGEDHAVKGSHGGEEGGGIEDEDNNKYHEGGEEELEAPPSCHCLLLL